MIGTIVIRAAVCAALFALWSVPADAQTADATAAVSAAMEPLEWLVGEWEGEAWIQMGPHGRETSLVTERVESRLDGRVLFVEGIGHEKAADGTPGEIVHHAAGVLSYDPDRTRYIFLAFRDGHVTDAQTSLEEGAFVWGFDVPSGGRVRFRIRQDGGAWLETGEFSRDDGATWAQFFEMRLHRTGTP